MISEINSKMSLQDRLAILRELLRTDPSGAFWDVVTALRGPDSPSEKPGMSQKEHDRAYGARRKRKFNTVEVIRERAVGDTAPGARRHADDKVIVPPKEERDHFDQHVVRAAKRLGLRVEVEDE